MSIQRGGCRRSSREVHLGGRGVEVTVRALCKMKTKEAPKRFGGPHSVCRDGKREPSSVRNLLTRFRVANVNPRHRRAGSTTANGITDSSPGKTERLTIPLDRNHVVDLLLAMRADIRPLLHQGPALLEDVAAPVGPTQMTRACR